MNQYEGRPPPPPLFESAIDDDDDDDNNNNNNLDDIYSAVIYGASHMRSLWFIWAKVGQRQVAANSQAKLQLDL